MTISAPPHTQSKKDIRFWLNLPFLPKTNCASLCAWKRAVLHGKSDRL